MSDGIKPNELRIGNWICDFGDGDGQVQGIDADGYVLTSANDVYQPHETFTAIPINEEWLVKLGFEKYTHSLFEHPSFDGQRQMKYSMADGFALQTIRSGFVWYIPEIKNVHQVQNIYYVLTGTELVLSGAGKV